MATRSYDFKREFKVTLDDEVVRILTWLRPRFPAAYEAMFLEVTANYAEDPGDGSDPVKDEYNERSGAPR